MSKRENRIDLIVITKEALIKYDPKMKVLKTDEYFAISITGEVFTPGSRSVIGTIGPFMVEDDRLMQELKPILEIRLPFNAYCNRMRIRKQARR